MLTEIKIPHLGNLDKISVNPSPLPKLNLFRIGMATLVRGIHRLETN